MRKPSSKSQLVKYIKDDTKTDCVTEVPSSDLDAFKKDEKFSQIANHYK